MRARSLLAWVAAVLLLSLGTEDPLYRIMVLGAVTAVYLARRRSGAHRRRPYWILVAGGSAILLNFVLSHTGATVLISLPPLLPAVGGPMTLEGLVYGADIAVGLMAALLAAAVLSQGLEGQELLESLPPQLRRTSAALSASVTLLPRLSDAFAQVREAQAMRGWRPRGPRSWRAVAVPALLTAIEGSVLLAEAMEARGLGSGPRTRMAPPATSIGDRVTLSAAATSIVLAAISLVTGALGVWQPYPTLQLPAIDLLPSLAAAALLVPAAFR